MFEMSMNCFAILAKKLSKDFHNGVKNGLPLEFEMKKENPPFWCPQNIGSFMSRNKNEMGFFRHFWLKRPKMH